MLLWKQHRIRDLQTMERSWLETKDLTRWISANMTPTATAPWICSTSSSEEVDYVIASVMFKGKKIPRYAIQTKKNGTFSFSSKEPKKVLRAINQYIPSERLVRSLSFFDVLKRNFMPSKKNAKIKK